MVKVHRHPTLLKNVSPTSFQCCRSCLVEIKPVLVHCIAFFGILIVLLSIDQPPVRPPDRPRSFAIDSVENPGTHVKQKSGVNREILKTGWNRLRQQLGYKAIQVKAAKLA